MTSVFEPPDIGMRPRIPDSAKMADRRQMKTKKSTREKIEKMMVEGAKNYPAYLKLIYTGDSELSSEEETVGGDASSTATRKLKSDLNSLKTDSADVISGESQLLSPAESHKLLDPGREKLPTPVDDETNLSAAKNKRNATTNSTRPTSGDNLPSSTICETPTSDIEDITSAISYDQRRLEDEWKLELYRLQDDISSLKTVLHTKLQVADDLKSKLGGIEKSQSSVSVIGPKHGFRNRIESLKESGTFQKTNAAFRTFGAYACRKFDNIRKSNIFKSFEDKVGHAKSKPARQTNVNPHAKLSISRSAEDRNNFGSSNSFEFNSDDLIDVNDGVSEY